MAPCGKPAAAVAGASAGAVAAPAPGVKRDSTLEVMVASMVGTAIEFYDNYCYSIAAASYFGLIFFTRQAKHGPYKRDVGHGNCRDGKRDIESHKWT